MLLPYVKSLIGIYSRIYLHPTPYITNYPAQYVKIRRGRDLGVFDKELPLEPAQPDVFRITQTNPPNGATGVDKTSSVIVTFNKPVAKFSVDSNFVMHLTTPPIVLGTNVQGTSLQSSDGKTITFNPSEPLQSGNS